jgi:hypothetical protein
MASTALSGTIADLTLIRNECLVVMKDSGGHSQAPLILPMNNNPNYNAMFSALLLASANRYVVDLTSEADGIYIVKVHVQ